MAFLNAATLARSSKPPDALLSGQTTSTQCGLLLLAHVPKTSKKPERLVQELHESLATTRAMNSRLERVEHQIMENHRLLSKMMKRKGKEKEEEADEYVPLVFQRKASCKKPVPISYGPSATLPTPQAPPTPKAPAVAEPSSARRRRSVPKCAPSMSEAPPPASPPRPKPPSPPTQPPPPKQSPLERLRQGSLVSTTNLTRASGSGYLARSGSLYEIEVMKEPEGDADVRTAPPARQPTTPLGALGTTVGSTVESVMGMVKRSASGRGEGGWL